MNLLLGLINLGFAVVIAPRSPGYALVNFLIAIFLFATWMRGRRV